MPTYAYLAITPNPLNSVSYSDPNVPQYHYVKIGHTSNATVYTRMMAFRNPLDDESKRLFIEDRARELNVVIPPPAPGSTSAIYLQRWCLQGSFQVGQFAKEWFYVPARLQALDALCQKVEEDADAVDQPIMFDDENEFALLFNKIFFP
ncbi:hypothetical protein ACJ41O_007404 [Fusarium nematophilum]